MSKKIFSLAIMCCFTVFGMSQNIGDTIKVQSFDYSSPTRDMMVTFPSDTSIKYEKIWMLYNMRCKGGLVSTGTNRNLGCGEWDYSCNTYLHDSTRFDSTLTTIPNYTISNYNGGTFNYSAVPLYDLYRKIEKKTTIISTTSEDIDTIGTGNISSSEAFAASLHTGKSQFIYTAAELLAAGITPGNIDALFLDVQSAGSALNQLKIKLKPTTKNQLIADSIDLTGFTEVFYSTTTLTTGLNRFQFHTPFVWDGISNIVVEYTFNGNQTGTNTLIKCNPYVNGGISGGGDYSLRFDQSNYIEANSYKGIGGNANRTMEAWIKTTTFNGEILSWGDNATGEKWNWRTTNGGFLRIEISGAGVVGGTNVADGNWHHVAAVQNGPNMSNIEFYVDGVLDVKTATSSAAINTNITSGINVQVSKGIHNRYLVGEMDGLRIWNTNLSLATINEWKRKKLTPNHPNFSNLEMNYLLNQKSSVVVIDSSANGNDGTIIGSQNRISFAGETLFKELKEIDLRPNVHFAQGVYVLNTVNDTLYDSVAHLSHTVVQNQVFLKSGEKRSDSIAAISTNIYYNADTKSYVYDEMGNPIDTITHVPDGTITIATLDFWNRFPTKFEIMSFVTPYGINLNLGATGKTWIFDVTDYTPFLEGNKRITMERGGQFQEEMDISFLFVVGTPERKILDIKEIWPVAYPSYTNIMSDAVFPPREVPLLPNGVYFNVKTAVTGHGQEGEFIPRTHYVKVGANQQFNWQAWKDCGENPVYPQGGTWIYDRAGWCPGMPTDLQNFDITNYVTAGDTALIDYGVTTASGTSNYIVSNKLITYGEYNHNLDAAIVDVVAPSNRVEYARENNICHYPKVTIRNAGKTPLTSLKIEFWVNNNATKEVFNWTGNLAPSQNEVVELNPPSTMWQTVVGVDNVFHVVVSNPNNGTDEYAFNNSYSSDFKVPAFIESPFRIDYRSNGASAETSFKIYNEYGTVIYSNSGQANNTISQDTLDLGLGCYRLVVTDTDGDGIGFWANNDGTGYLRFHKMTGQAAMAIQPDFGSSYTFNFTIGSPLSLGTIQKNNAVALYPNPTNGDFTLEGNDIEQADIKVINSLGQEVWVNLNKMNNRVDATTRNLSAGIYTVIVTTEGNRITKRLVVK
jgi:hypothetical protein